MNSLEVSVVIPTYNRKTVLGETLHRISNQTFPKDKYEVIVVDDCSMDGTQEYLRSLKYLVSTRHILNNTNLGRAKTRNRGIREAKGKYILMIDDDIWASNNLIEKHYEEHMRHSEDVAVVGAILVANEVPKTAVNEFLNDHHRWCYIEMSKYKDSLPFNFCKTASLSMSKEVLFRVGFFNEAFVNYGGEDTELGYRLDRYGIKLFFARDAFGHHFHDESVENFITRSISLGREHIVFLKQHPEADSGKYQGFFTAHFHNKFTSRLLLYNLIKLLIFTPPARLLNMTFIKLFNSRPKPMMANYLLPILKMQFIRRGMKEVEHENRD